MPETRDIISVPLQMRMPEKCKAGCVKGVQSRPYIHDVASVSWTCERRGGSGYEPKKTNVSQ